MLLPSVPVGQGQDTSPNSSSSWWCFFHHRHTSICQQGKQFVCICWLNCTLNLHAALLRINATSCYYLVCIIILGLTGHVTGVNYLYSRQLLGTNSRITCPCDVAMPRLSLFTQKISLCFVLSFLERAGITFSYAMLMLPCQVVMVSSDLLLRGFFMFSSYVCSLSTTSLLYSPVAILLPSPPLS